MTEPDDAEAAAEDVARDAAAAERKRRPRRRHRSGPERSAPKPWLDLADPVWAEHLAALRSGELTFGRPSDEPPRFRFPPSTGEPVRARFFCHRHEAPRGARQVAWVTNTKGYNDRLGTAMDDVPYPMASRDVMGDCDWCDDPQRRFVIRFARLRAAVNAAPANRVLRADIDTIADRPGDRTQT